LRYIIDHHDHIPPIINDAPPIIKAILRGSAINADPINVSLIPINAYANSSIAIHEL
jgi:hypothetical protein